MAPTCLRCDPFLHSGYQPPWTWLPGWGGTPGGPGIDPNALAIKCPVAPATAVAGTPDVTVTIPGQNFTATCVASFAGTPVATTFVSATQLTCVVPSSTAAIGAHQITVNDPTLGAAIGSCPFTITAAPILTMVCPVAPASVLVNSGATTITVTGTLFVQGTTVAMLDGVDQVTTVTSPTTLTFPFTPGAAAATHTISVKDGANTATTTCPFQVTLTPLLFVTCPVAPATAIAGSTTPLTVTVNGGNFTATTVATVDGADQATTFISATQISFGLTVPATVPSVQTLQIGARDGANTAAATCPFTITPAALLKPTITYKHPDMIGMDDPVKTITVTGTNFDATSEVILGGALTRMVTTYISPTQLSFVTQSPMWTNGLMQLRVQNGGSLQATSTETTYVEVRTNPGETSPLMLNPALTSTPAGGPPVTVELAGSGFGDPIQATIDGVRVPTTRSGGVLSFTVDPGPLASGTVLQISCSMGHDHPEGHDDVKPVPMQQVPFTIT